MLSPKRIGSFLGGVFLLAVLGLALLGRPTVAQEEEEDDEQDLSNESCALCHDSEDLVKKGPDGTLKSLYVSEEDLTLSAHSG